MVHRGEGREKRKKQGKHRRPKDEEPQKCKNCKGKGVVPDPDHGHVDCPVCGGTGVV